MRNKMKRTVKAPGFKILVKIKQITEKFFDEGLIVKATQNSKRHQEAMCVATVHKMGRNAYKAYDDGEPWCREGDLVLISRYSGVLVDDEVIEELGLKSELGSEYIYRVINDSDVNLVSEVV